MVDWTSSTPDATVAERATAFLPLRVPGSPDQFKETPVNGFVTYDGSGNVAVGTVGSGYRFEVGSNGAGYWNGSGWTAGLPTAAVISNSTPGGYDAVVIGRMTDTGGTIKNAWAMGSVGTGPWTAGNNAVQTAEIYVAARNALGGIAEALRISVAAVRAGVDNAQALGTASIRWSTVFAATGAINTSDARQKEWRGLLTDAEVSAALEIVDTIGLYQWKDAVVEKGAANARLHTGVKAQQVWTIMAAHGLISEHAGGVPASKYAFLCYDKWDEERRVIYETVTRTRAVQREELVQVGKDDQGEPVYQKKPVTVEEQYEEQIDTGRTELVHEAGDSFGIRPDQLQFFLLAAMARRMSGLEARLRVLESA